jgi:hypothetical protein
MNLHTSSQTLNSVFPLLQHSALLFGVGSLIKLVGSLYSSSVSAPSPRLVSVSVSLSLSLLLLSVVASVSSPRTSRDVSRTDMGYSWGIGSSGCIG